MYDIDIALSLILDFDEKYPFWKLKSMQKNVLMLNNILSVFKTNLNEKSLTCEKICLENKRSQI